MKIFISWSGERSRAVAEALRVWLPDVVHFLEPWVSSEDVSKGARWAADLARQLEDTNVGLICLTPDNLLAPWILFEAGALSKALEKGLVCTYLLQVKPADLTGPLVQFQATEATEKDTLKLLRTLNSLLGPNTRSDEQLNRAFTKWWPELAKALEKVPLKTLGATQIRSDRELFEEMLDLLRSQAKVYLPSSERFATSLPIFDLLEDEDLNNFAKSIHLDGGPADENGADWFTKNRRIVNKSTLDGVWASRWNGTGTRLRNWRTGVAVLVVRGKFLTAVYEDNDAAGNPYLIVARQNSSGIFVGHYANFRKPSDSTPWVGVVVDKSRIDGQFCLRRALTARSWSRIVD